jgi:hypothetical protein
VRISGVTIAPRPSQGTCGDEELDLGASAAAAEPSVKTAIWATNMRRRPKWSPRGGAGEQVPLQRHDRKEADEANDDDGRFHDADGHLPSARASC